MNKIYICHICNKEMKKPYRRLSIQQYGRPILLETGKVVYRNQMYNLENQDYCEKCFKKYANFINKLKEHI